MSVIQWTSFIFSFLTALAIIVRWKKMDRVTQLRAIAPFIWAVHVVIYYLTLLLGLFPEGTTIRFGWSSGLRLHAVVIIVVGIGIYLFSLEHKDVEPKG